MQKKLTWDLSNIPNAKCLNVGDIQQMSFQPTDPGPFYLLPEEREARRNDVRSNDTQKKKYTKRQLCDKIMEKTNGLTKPKGNLKEIQQVAVQLNIPLDYTRSKVIEGWQSKPKGMLQILWERGFINPNNFEINNYTVNGKKDEKGDIVESSNLKALIANLPVFKSEITMLQYRAEQLGV